MRTVSFVLGLFFLQFSTACSGDDDADTGDGNTETGGAPGSDGSGGADGSGGDVGSGGSLGSGGSVLMGGPGREVPPPYTGDVPTAVEAAAHMGLGVNLGQMFDNTQHPRTLDAAAAKIDAYYERGFRHVRIPVTWTEEVGGDMLVTDPTVGTIDRDHPRLAVIESVIDHALSKDSMFVIINAHHEHALKTEARSEVLQQLWADIADIFQDKDHRLIFEVLNEPHKDDTTAMAKEDVRLMTGLAYDEIRAVDSERIVVIGGDQWFGAHEVPRVWTDLDPVGGGSDPYVMATFHHYNPWTFCGDNQGDYADAWTESDISSPMETMADWAADVGQGMPIYIGEWGVAWASRYSTLTCNNIRDWYIKFDSQFAAPRGMPTTVWDDGGWFQIFNHNNNMFTNNLIECIEGECAWDGTERMNEGCL